METDDQSGLNPVVKPKHWSIFFVAIIIFFIALIVRYIGLKFGFPLFTHPDEGYLMNAVRDMSFNQTLDPGTYVYPAFPSFYSKFLFLNIFSFLKFGGNYGWFYWRDPFFFYFASRLMTAIQGALLPVVAWFIGRKFKQIDFSWPAAVLFIFYPPFVLHSHYVTVDIPLTLYVMLVLLFCLNYLSSRKTVWLVMACVMVSIAAMEKYPGILSFGIVLVSIGVQALCSDKQNNVSKWRSLLKTSASSILVCAVVILVIALPLFRNFDTAWNQIVQEARPNHLGADGLGWGGNLLFYLKDFYTNSGLIISVLVSVGLVVAILMKDPAYLLLFFGGGYWIALSVLRLHHSRWSLPMMTTPLFLAAIGVSYLWQKTRHQKAGRIAFSIFIVAVFLPFVLKGTVTSLMLTWPDTRNEALRYMEENNITDEKTVSDGYTPYNPNNKNDVFSFDVTNPGEKEYLVLSSFMGDRYAAEPDRYVAENAFYAYVRSHLVLIEEFEPDPEPTLLIDQLKVVLEYINRQFRDSKPLLSSGPTLEIYRLQE